MPRSNYSSEAEYKASKKGSLRDDVKKAYAKDEKSRMGGGKGFGDYKKKKKAPTGSASVG